MVNTDLKKLLKKYETDNIYELAERMNFFVYNFKLPKKVRGMYCYVQRNKMVALNESLSDDGKEDTLIELIKFGIKNCKCSMHLI